AHPLSVDLRGLPLQQCSLGPVLWEESVFVFHIDKFHFWCCLKIEHHHCRYALFHLSCLVFCSESAAHRQFVDVSLCLCASARAWCHSEQLWQLSHKSDKFLIFEDGNWVSCDFKLCF
uniref:Uncharacterized protein n=1 Tax=Electrophorus electricus TaxID=8005 RepID=A0AAY5EMF2_ELEEL